MTTAGGFIYTVASHPELIGERVRYRIGFDARGIEQLAISIEPSPSRKPRSHPAETNKAIIPTTISALERRDV
jgi:hypothetical protein